jgi:hypothetical protein
VLKYDLTSVCTVLLNCPCMFVLCFMCVNIPVDLLIVLDTERLFSQLRREIPEFVKIILLPKSGGVIFSFSPFVTT